MSRCGCSATEAVELSFATTHSSHRQRRQPQSLPDHRDSDWSLDASLVSLARSRSSLLYLLNLTPLNLDLLARRYGWKMAAFCCTGPVGHIHGKQLRKLVKLTEARIEIAKKRDPSSCAATCYDPQNGESPIIFLRSNMAVLSATDIDVTVPVFIFMGKRIGAIRSPLNKRAVPPCFHSRTRRFSKAGCVERNQNYC